MSSKPLGTNPKDRQAAKKCDLSVLPAIAIYHAAHAMVDGALKYGPYNWRENAVLARVYLGAMKRHIARWEAGEELTAEDTHNLGNVMACCAILLDAQATGNLGDDRAKNPELLRVMDEVDAKCKVLEERKALLLADAKARQEGKNLDGSPRRETVPAGSIVYVDGIESHRCVRPQCSCASRDVAEGCMFHRGPGDK